tara:strand:+ start:823 stop:1524 length:702 start_codon:yes stop_codon:yes gene_type:complete
MDKLKVRDLVAILKAHKMDNCPPISTLRKPQLIDLITKMKLDINKRAPIKKREKKSEVKKKETKSEVKKKSEEKKETKSEVKKETKSEVKKKSDEQIFKEMQEKTKKRYSQKQIGEMIKKTQKSLMKNKLKLESVKKEPVKKKSPVKKPTSNNDGIVQKKRKENTIKRLNDEIKKQKAKYINKKKTTLDEDEINSKIEERLGELNNMLKYMNRIYRDDITERINIDMLADLLE